jgi:DNA-binding transcriptional MerR regulator
VDEREPGALYPVGIAAQRAGLTPRQLRYYEALGLVAPQRRGSRRLYAEADIALLREIRRLHRGGTRLEHIREALRAFRPDDEPRPAAVLPEAQGADEDNDVHASALGRRPPPSLYPLRDRRAIEERIDRYERDVAPVGSHPVQEKERSHGEPGNAGDGRPHARAVPPQER